MGLVVIALVVAIPRALAGTDGNVPLRPALRRPKAGEKASAFCAAQPEKGESRAQRKREVKQSRHLHLICKREKQETLSAAELNYLHRRGRVNGKIKGRTGGGEGDKL